MTKFQNYSHYKLPITIKPLEYGKLIEQFDNKYIIQLNTSNVFVIVEKQNENYIKLFRKGELMFEFKDVKKSEITFVRTIQDQRYTFENNKLISTEILSVSGVITIYPLYEDTNAITLKKITPFNFNIDFIFNWIENSKDPVKAFLIWELCLGFFFFIIIIILPDLFLNIDNNLTLASVSSVNIIKLRRRQSIHNWNIMEFSISNLLFTRKLFESKLDLFWNKINEKFTNENHMYILFKVKYKGSDYATIGNLQKISKNDKVWYLNWIINNMDFKSEYYNETPIEAFVFSYGFKNEKIDSKDLLNPNINFQKYKNSNLPISVNPMDYGKLINKIILKDSIVYFLQSDNGLAITLRKFKEYNLIDFFKNGNCLITFKDEIISENKFIRIVNNKKYYFENGEQFLLTKDMKSKFISKLSTSKNFNNKFITLDIETFIKDSILIVYCISIFDGNFKKSFFLNDFKNVDELIITALKSIMLRKYNKTNVYIHNMANFDIIFLLKYLVKLGSVHPTIHNGRIISIDFTFGKDSEYKIHFRDSYLLLTASLKKLCESFKVEDAKSIFPHFFVNENNLDYKGDVPDFKFFDKVNKDEYNIYKSNFKNNWSLRNEAVKYCELDCVSLHQVIFKFTELIFDLFGRSVHHYPTLPSLAFGIFRAKFMEENLIPQVSGKIARDIRSGYTGGSVDVFIPESKPHIKIKCYDVNSLYPSQMQSQLMPVGNPTYFSGDITKINVDAFGFFYCKIIAPDDIKHPILQTHVKTHGGMRTISPIGTWEDMIFSVEMENAKKYGYKFEILWGYTFKGEYIFSDYVDFLYNFRLNYPKSDPMNYSAKLLMNSLYGRFGMDDNFTEVNIIHKDFYPDFENKFLDVILEIQDLGDYKLVTYKLDVNDIIEEESTHNVSIGIAAAITAYSRIHMSQFKNNPKIILYYTDTDSVYVDENSDIPENLINSKILGKLKLENTCSRAIFLASKLYCLEKEDNKIISKVKGLKQTNDLTFNDFKNLLYKDVFIEKSQTKWMRKLSKGHIELLDQLYTLKVTDNKRKLIFNKNGKFVSTKAYKINKDKVIID